jgi:hypothetical protein
LQIRGTTYKLEQAVAYSSIVLDENSINVLLSSAAIPVDKLKAALNDGNDDKFIGQLSGAAVQRPGLDSGQRFDPAEIGNHETDQGRRHDERADHFQGALLGRDRAGRGQAVISDGKDSQTSHVRFSVTLHAAKVLPKPFPSPAGRATN